MRQRSQFVTCLPQGAGLDACTETSSLTLSSFSLEASSHTRKCSLTRLKVSNISSQGAQLPRSLNNKVAISTRCCCSITAAQMQQVPVGNTSKSGTVLPNRKEETSNPTPAVAKEQPVNDASNCAKLLFSGAMSAVVSRTCVAPLERVKMDLLLNSPTSTSALSTATRVFQSEGIKGFWKGNLLNVLRTAPFKALNFFSFDMYRRLFIDMSGGVEGNTERFAAGAAAGITATLVCFPLDVLRTRVLAQSGRKYPGSPLQTLVGMVRFEGVGALYAGCLPAVIAMAPAGAVFYGVYDMLKSSHLRRMAEEQRLQGGGELSHEQPPPLPPVYTLMYGAMAGLSSEVVVYPLEVLRRKMQLQSMLNAATAAAVAGTAVGGRGAVAAAAAAEATPALLMAAQQLVAVACGIASRNGIAGFYAGIVPNLLQVLPSSALSYFTYETVKNYLHAAS